MNALMLLKTDHKTVETLFKQFEKLGDSQSKQKKLVVQKIVKELSVHAAIEEQLFYPAVRKAVKAAEDIVLESLEEHHIVKTTLAALAKMNGDEERFDAKVTVLIEMVRHHVKEEEGDMFPKVRAKMEPKKLSELGAMMEKAKKAAPTRPHPSMPDTPPGNLLLGAGMSLIDKAMDTGKGMMRSMAKRRDKRSNGHTTAPRQGRAPNGSSARPSR